MFTIVGLLLISCKPITVFEPTIASDGIKEDIIIVEEFSPFVDSIGPPPGSITDMITYEKTLNSLFPHDRGIHVILKPNHIDDFAQPISAPIVQRTTLFVDGDMITQDIIMIASGGMLTTILDDQGEILYEGDLGPYYLSWAVPLSIGKHQVELRVISNVDKVYSFNWDFTISGG